MSFLHEVSIDGSVSEDSGNTQLGSPEKSRWQKCWQTISFMNCHMARWEVVLQTPQATANTCCLFVKLSECTWINWDCSWCY